jgi:hypothetical protein
MHSEDRMRTQISPRATIIAELSHRRRSAVAANAVVYGRN